MTPHRHWFRSYEPFVIPIRLTDNQVVYSAGVGSVVFELKIEGRKGRPVEFTRVLLLILDTLEHSEEQKTRKLESGISCYIGTKESVYYSPGVWYKLLKKQGYTGSR